MRIPWSFVTTTNRAPVLCRTASPRRCTGPSASAAGSRAVAPARAAVSETTTGSTARVRAIPRASCSAWSYTRSTVSTTTAARHSATIPATIAKSTTIMRVVNVPAGVRSLLMRSS